MSLAQAREGWQVFQELIAPVDPNDFLQTYYEKQELVVERSEAGHHRSILTLDDIDRAITELNLSASQIRLVDAKVHEPIKSADYIDPRGFVDARRVFQLFDQGATIILPQLNRLLPKLAQFCAALETVFTQPFQTNVYMTPARAQGFKVHYDTHDVFIVQAAGSKDWSVYEPLINLPLKGQPYDSAVHKFGDAKRSFRLEAGATAYIPRGMPHDACSTGDVSLHVTVGVLSHTWTDLLIEAIADVCLQVPELRQSLPAGYASAEFDRPAAERQFRDLLERVVSQADFEKAFSAFADEFVGTRRQHFRDQLHVMRAAAIGIGLDQPLKRRDFLIYSLQPSDDGSSVVLKTYGLEMRLPVGAAEPVTQALSAASFTTRDLPGPLDEDSRLILVRRLMQEGLVIPA